MNYQVKKSIWAAATPLCIIFFWLIIPLIVMICRMLANSAFSIEFYDSKIVQKSGLLNKKETSNVFTGVLAVSVSQSFMGRILGYGDVQIDVPGKWDIDTTGVKDPQKLKAFLEGFIQSGAGNSFYVSTQ